MKRSDERSAESNILSPEVATAGHRKKSKNALSTEDKSHDSDRLRYAVIQLHSLCIQCK